MRNTTKISLLVCVYFFFKRKIFCNIYFTVDRILKIYNKVKCFDVLIVCNNSIYFRMLAVELELIFQY